ncbi:MAG TPA: hypothetical protein VF062_25940 [Candidatus Limnocylindrales bacterium]
MTARPVPHRIARAVGVALTAGLVLALLPAAAGASPAEAVRDTTAETTRTVPAYLDSDHPDRLVRIFTVSFQAVDVGGPHPGRAGSNRRGDRAAATACRVAFRRGHFG